MLFRSHRIINILVLCCIYVFKLIIKKKKIEEQEETERRRRKKRNDDLWDGQHCAMLNTFPMFCTLETTIMYD